MFYEEIMCQLLLLSLSALCSQLKAFDALETISQSWNWKDAAKRLQQLSPL